MSRDLLVALKRLDSLLESGIARAEVAYGAGAAADSFRGLHIDLTEVERLLAREPGEPLLSTSGQHDPWAGLLASTAPELGLAPFDLDVLVIALAPELDLRYERLYAYLHDDVTRRRPTVDLTLNLLCDTAEDRLARRGHFQADAPLIRNGVVRLLADPRHAEPPLLACSLKVDEQIIAYLTGSDGIDARLASFCTIDAPPPSCRDRALPDQLAQLVEPLAEAAAKRTTLRLFLHGPSGIGQRTLAEQAAARASKPLLAADLSRAPDGPPLAQLVRVLLREAAFRDALCFIDGLDPLLAGGRDADRQSFARELVASTGPVVLAGFRSWPSPQVPGVDGPTAVHVVPCPLPGFGYQRQTWRLELDRAGICLGDEDLDALAGRFRLTPAQIAEAAVTACPPATRPAPVGVADVFVAARAQTGHELGELTVKLATTFGWADIVLPDDSVIQLKELCQRVAHRHRVLDEWGFSSTLSLGRGVSALFAGPPGTGKTMAAEIVAGELGLDLCRIDLAGVVSKWIGETEKNLDRIFRAAQNANAVLLFDEAEALFGKRSEVRDSHDRYANIEISYLLQRVETYEGLAILTTNRIEDLDEAFLRRLGFVVRFPFPDEAERMRIWAAVWPGGVPMADDLDWTAIARELAFSGAEIKNVALGAAFLAAEAGTPVTMEHVQHAARREYEKAGNSFGEPQLARLRGAR